MEEIGQVEKSAAEKRAFFLTKRGNKKRETKETLDKKYRFTLGLKISVCLSETCRDDVVTLFFFRLYTG